MGSLFPVGGLILVNAFASLRSVVTSMFGEFVARAFREGYVNEKSIANVSCPVLFIHGANDRTVPVEHSVRLFEKCRSRKILVTPDNMEHNSHLFAEPGFLA